MKRVFILKRKSGNVTLQDPNPDLTLESIIDLYAPQYPELTTIKHTMDVKDGVVTYTLEPKIGKLG